MKLKSLITICAIIIVMSATLLFQGCATKATYTHVAKMHQETEVKFNWTSQIGENPEMAGWQERIKQEGWSDNMVSEIISYLYDLESYTVFGICGKFDYWCSPKQFKMVGYKGSCMSLTGHHYHVFRYLKYPYGLRLEFVRLWGFGHIILKIQRKDGSWRMMDSDLSYGLKLLDRPFYFKVIQWDDKEIY